MRCTFVSWLSWGSLVILNGYISEFQRFLVMVYDISECKRVMLFMEGLVKPLQESIKSSDPSSLQEVMTKAQDLESSS